MRVDGADTYSDGTIERMWSRICSRCRDAYMVIWRAEDAEDERRELLGQWHGAQIEEAAFESHFVGDVDEVYTPERRAAA